MAGSGGGTTTTQNKTLSEPYASHLGGILNEAEWLHNSGVGNQQWGGPTVAGLDPDLSRSFDMTRRLAGQNTSQPYNYISGVMGSNGMTPGMQGAANNLAGVADAYGSVGANAGNAGNYYSGGINDLYNASRGQNNDVYGNLSGIMGQAGGPTAADTNLGDIARTGGVPYTGSANPFGRGGGTMFEGRESPIFEGEAGKNPYLTQMLDANTERLGNKTASLMSGAGRYGSFGHGDAMARSIAEANNPLLSSAYESDQNRRMTAFEGAENRRLTGHEGAENRYMTSREADEGRRFADYEGGLNRRLAATSQIDAARLGYGGLGVNAANSLGGMRNADTQLGAGLLGQGFNMNNQTDQTRLAALQGQSNTNLGLLGAYGNMQGQALTAAGMAPEMDALRYAGADRMAGIGQYGQNRSQQELDQQRQMWEQGQNMPWQSLSRYAGLMGGFNPLMQGSTNTDQTQQQTMGWGDMAKFGAQVAPYAVTALSDRDAKTDIVKIGQHPETGLDLYSYRYKGDPKTYPKVVGPMAQDIEAAYPGSTERIGKYLVVKPHAAWLLGVD